MLVEKGLDGQHDSDGGGGGGVWMVAAAMETAHLPILLLIPCPGTSWPTADWPGLAAARVGALLAMICDGALASTA